MKTVRIFISSPGDVVEERERARQVVEGLRRRYAGRFHLKPVLWEELPLQADMSFQQGIDLVLSREQGIDIALFILWSRLGSPLGALGRKPDGSECRVITGGRDLSHFPHRGRGPVKSTRNVNSNSE